MNASPSHQSASSAAARKHFENARYAVSLGAAFALLCAVVFDTPETQAAGGIFELLFGGGGTSYNIQPSPSYGYGYGAEGGRRYGQRRHAHHSSRTTRYAHYRRHRSNAATTESRVAERRATERHHVAASTRRALDARLASATRENRDTVADADRPIAQGARPQSERRSSGVVETVAFTDTANTPNPGVVSRRAVCVRACDGYYFPIAAKGSETAAQQSCERLCPGAQTQVFMMPRGSTKIDEAVAANGGETYSAFVARLNPDEAKSKSCGCPQTAGNLNDTAAFLSDLTLRPGDTVVTPEGVRIVRRGSRYPFKSSDFLSLAETRDVPRSTRGALFAIERALKTPYGRLAVANNSERRQHRRSSL